MSIVWTIIIGFVAGVIAKFLHPGSNEPSGLLSPRCSASPVPSSRPTSARRSAGTAPTRARAWSAPSANIFLTPGTWSSETTSNETPLPAALPLFATGLGVLGLIGWRRKRKQAA